MAPAPHSPRAGDPGAIALYVHWPFCKSKCPYCDFNSHVRDAVDHAAWARALVAEVERVAAQAPGRVLTSIFFGGGTPSLMAPATVDAVIAAADRAWTFAPDIEITLEANPTSVEAGKLRDFRAAGVNRASLGVQSLAEEDLRFLGRQHSAAEAMAAVAEARAVFPRVSFDLIYARPGQTVESWAAELDHALSFGPDHLSVYQLTIEEGTAFHAAVRRGDWSPPDEDTQAALYEATGDILAAAGLPAYEISNHARPGNESRHNLTYWRYGDYAGIGPGAHGRLCLDGGAVATAAYRKPETWMEAAGRGDGTESITSLDPETRVDEAVMMGLRLAEGVPIARLERLGGRPFAELIAPWRVERLVAGGFLSMAEGVLTATDRGRAVLNGLLGELLA
ncbi:radical SAM family heme chaperone HemW [Zavarzinia compransoris]|uniref:radical SAM family heme chaperone HemW n=1 Tax=Zavarzinia marina TaxID=2911065 RepID=UPI001F29CB84|nr:radical SAM family heme chaperone HemW [Zavarzinia marina]MCF4166718.1 radical SAM family heme chaperone HemW [Zavarzinia marina]